MIFFEKGWHSHGDIFAEILKTSIEEVPSSLLKRIKKGKALLYTEKLVNSSEEMGLELMESLSLNTIENLEPGESIEYTRAV